MGQGFSRAGGSLVRRSRRQNRSAGSDLKIWTGWVLATATEAVAVGASPATKRKTIRVDHQLPAEVRSEVEDIAFVRILAGAG
jgi:hypothetical protein